VGLFWKIWNLLKLDQGLKVRETKFMIAWEIDVVFFDESPDLIFSLFPNNCKIIQTKYKVCPILFCLFEYDTITDIYH